MAEPRSLNLPASGTATQQYELAPGLAQYVQSVYIEVDNTAGADARPTLTLSEQSGVVIAKKRQGDSIPAAVSGSATWALRLADESANSGGAGIEFDTLNVGGYLSVETTSTGEDDPQGITLNSGDAEILIQTFDPGSGVVQAVGNLVWLRTDSGLCQLQLNDDGDAVFTNSQFTMFTTIGYTLRGVTCTLRLNDNSGKVEVQDGAGNPIFRVNGDGSLQGKTGKSLTFNL